jgi:PAS domain S-box-containing protein
VKNAVFVTKPGSDGKHCCLAETVLESTHQAVAIFEKTRRRIVYANPAFVAMTGYSVDEIRGKSLRYFKSERHNDAFYRQIWRALEEKGSWFGEVWGRIP